MKHQQQSHTVIGSLHRIDDKRGAVRMETVFSTNPEDLWSALTTPDRLARWIATVHGDLRLNGTFSARFTSGWEGVGRVDVCEAPRRLAVTLMPGTSDQTVMDAILTPDGDATHLVVEERGIPVVEIDAHGAGWQVHVEDLHAYLEESGVAGWEPRAKSLRPQYKQMAAELKSDNARS